MPPVTRILLLEDNTPDAEIVECCLTEPACKCCYTVEHVTSLAAALRSSLASPPDAALIDLNVTDSQGSATALQYHRTLPDIPIIALTGIDDEDIAIDLIAQGITGFISKAALHATLSAGVQHQLCREIRYAIARTNRQNETDATAHLERAAAIEKAFETRLLRAASHG